MLRFLGMLAAITVLHVWAPPEAISADDRPNFLIIITDDQRYDTFNRDYMPLTTAMIAEQGVSFQRAYVAAPSCCPSRASILTGMLPRRTGVLRNSDTLNLPTVANHLHDAGYYTGLIGKYLNSWDGSPRPEFDYWTSFSYGQTPYYNPLLNVNGAWSNVPGYITYILRDHAIRFLNQVPAEQPFLLFFTPNAPHGPAEAAPEDVNLFQNAPLPKPPNVNENDMADKPAWLQGLPSVSAAEVAAYEIFMRRQLRTLASLDRSIAEILRTLESQRKLDKTVVIFLSDNGLLWGEHRIWVEKWRVYEPSIRVPFAVRYPPLAPTPRTDFSLVANVDIAPTLYELAGLPIPSDVDGFSLTHLLRGTDQWQRDALLIEDWDLYPPFRALHTGRYVYVETPSDQPELYDLEHDPYQLQNLIQSPDYAETAHGLATRLNGEIERISPPMKRPLAPWAVNAASFFPSPVRTLSGFIPPPATAVPGSIASVFGMWLSSENVVANEIPLPTSLATTTIRLAGRAVPQLSLSSDHSLIQIPWELAGREQVEMIVSVGGVAGRPETVRLSDYAPGIFTIEQTSRGRGFVELTATGELVGPAGSLYGRPSRPARRGEFITIFCTGLGPVTNQPETGSPAQFYLSQTLTAPVVTVGGVTAPILFSGLAPWQVGIYQIVAQVPLDASPGAAIELAISIGGAVSNTVSIPVE
jgi:uncharacterized protein (TIGR03437 family)